MINTSSCDPVDNTLREGLTVSVGNASEMKCSVIMESHEAARLDRREIRNSVRPRLVRCVLCYARRSRLANPERKCLDLI
jgi:hypothetical protein